jgi:streptomycin 6-kinase
MIEADVPVLDDLLHRRLRRRFGAMVEPWLDQLPPVLRSLAERWGLKLDSLIQRGSVSVVLRCRTDDGAASVLKVSPDRMRIHQEAEALTGWNSPCVPAVLAVDDQLGAVLLGAIEPGTPLDLSPEYPSLESLGALLACLHQHGPPGVRRSVTDRINDLFESGRKNYERRPDLGAVIPPDLYEQGRQLALRLAADTRKAVVLHGDLTPVNILIGGPDRGLVAIDPAPCFGDPGFDIIDLLLWKAEGLETVTMRAEQLAPQVGVPVDHALTWCAAFAPMTALELAEASPSPPPVLDWLLALTAAETR